MSADDACRELDSKKRWIENFMNDKKPDDVERYLKQFTDALTLKEGNELKGAPQLATYKTYLQEATQRFNSLKISEEADNLIRKFNDGLRNMDRSMEYANSGSRDSAIQQCRNTLARIQGEVKPLLTEHRYLTYPAAKEFVDKYEATVRAKEDQLDAFGEQGEWETADRSVKQSNQFLDRLADLDSIKRRGHAEEAQQKTEQVTEQLKLYAARWKGKFTADETIKLVQASIDKAYIHIAIFDGKADPAAKAAMEKSEIEQAISYLSPSIQTCVKEKTCTFSSTRRSFVRQLYYSCKDCGSDYGLCYVCSIYCHKTGPYAKHKLEEKYTVADMYCDCGASGDGICCSLPGHKRQVEPAAPKVNPAAALASAAASSSTVSDFKSVPHEQASEEKPAWIYDLSDRRMPMKLKSALSSHNEGAKHLNQYYADRKPYLERLSGKDDSFAHVRSCLDSIYDQLKHSLVFFERAVKEVDEYETGHPIKSELTAHAAEMRAFVEKQRGAWMTKADWAESTANLASALEQLQEKLEAAERTTSEGQIEAYSVQPALEQYDRIGQLFQENPAFEHPMRKTWAGDKERFLKQSIANLTKAFVHLIQSEYGHYNAEIYRKMLSQVAPGAPELKQMEQAEKEQKVRREKAEAEAKVRQAKEAEESAKRDAAQRKQQKETFLDPYKGGTIRVGRQEVWQYKADGTLSFPHGSLKWDGTDLYGGNILGSGYWNGNNWSWTFNGRIFASYDWQGAPDNAFSPHYTTGARPCWKWDGTHLTPSVAAWSKDTCVVEGSVPLPVTLFVALKAYIEKMTKLFNGVGKCNSGLFGDKTPCSVCDNCRSADNFKDGCAVCTTIIQFPTNRAYVCKTCSNSTSYCARCGVIGARHAAFLCEECQYIWKDKCVRKR